LPTGLSLSASGLISGTPTAAGIASFTVEVKDNGGATATMGYSITIGIGISPPSLPVGTAGAHYSATLTAGGGAAPYAWRVASGALPPGVSLSGATGVISGTPTVAGTFSFTVSVTDHSNPVNSGARAYSIAVALGVSPSSLPHATVKASYSVTLTASGGTAPYDWVVVSGALAKGLSLSATKGVISGIPTTAGTSTFTVKVTDHANPVRSGTRTYSLVVTMEISPSSLPAATIRVAYSVTLSASGGTAPYTWKVVSGSLPAGLSLSATKGTISGVPTKAGTYTFTVEVTDHSKLTATRTFSLLVKA
jgi:hypothetical protein